MWVLKHKIAQVGTAHAVGGTPVLGVTNLIQSTTRMSENVQPTTKPTLGLTGLTVNAMALIAPGAFLWLTFAQQCL
jgi:hypothetical protein